MMQTPLAHRLSRDAIGAEEQMSLPVTVLREATQGRQPPPCPQPSPPTPREAWFMLQRDALLIPAKLSQDVFGE